MMLRTKTSMFFCISPSLSTARMQRMISPDFLSTISFLQMSRELDNAHILPANIIYFCLLSSAP